jgi:hypothetical protein
VKKQLWLITAFLILASLACSLPWQSTSTSTSSTDTDVPHTIEETIAPTEDVMVETPMETTEVPDQTLPIVYGDRSTDPPQLVVLDPLDGSEIMRLDAPDLGYGGIGGVSGSGIFYLDADYQQAYRVGFNNTLQELLFLNPDGGYFEGVILPSPDGTQIAKGAVLSFDTDGSHVQFLTVNIDGTDERVLLDKPALDRPLRPTPIKWSEDGLSIYYTNVIEGIEGYGGLDLIKVDVAVGTSEVIFPDSGGLNSTSVSPGEVYAARAVSGEPLSIVIRDLATGIDQTVTFPMKYRQAWNMVWAPDASSLLVTIGLGNWENDEYSIVKIDPVTLDMTFLITDDDTLPRVVAWQVPETIWLNDTDGNLWKMDSTTLTMTLVAGDVYVIPISR